MNTYWGQFEGLLDHLKAYSTTIASHIRGNEGVTLVDAGMVDSPERSQEAALMLKEAGVELVFVYISTYCLSSTILPISNELRCPFVLLNIQPDAAIDYKAINSLGDRGKMTGLWLENCQACSIPELASVFKRSGRPYDIVTGHLHDDQTWDQLDSWVSAVAACHGMRHNRLGLLGHYYC